MYNSFVSLLSYWLPPLTWMALINPFMSDSLSLSGNSRYLIPLLEWLLPVASAEEIYDIYILIRKVGHFVGYGILAWLLFRAIRGDAGQRMKRQWIVAASFLTIAFSFFDEYAQSLVPDRHPSIFDCLIDAGGVMVAMIILTRLNRTEPTTVQLADNPAGMGREAARRQKSLRKYH